MTRPSYRNALRAQLAEGGFAFSVECVTPAASDHFEVAIAPFVELSEQVKGDPRIHGLAVTDRVKSDDDHDPVRLARHLAEASGKAPIVHLSGKDRDSEWLQEGLARAQAAGLENLLLITGDTRMSPCVRTISPVAPASPGRTRTN
jgi:5,10-methylenetetrahydrofolate reductase